jgi:glycosyltransferase involved in cell wall biosynthesis
MTPLRIGMIVNSPSPHQKVLLDRLFTVPGVDLALAYAYPSNRARDWGAPLADGHTMLLPFQPDLLCARRLRHWVTTARRDVWILGSVFTAMRTQVMASVLRRSGRPWAFLGEPPRPRTGCRAIVRDGLMRRVLRHCDGVIATGNESARRYHQLLGDDRPVTSVPYYIPLGDWLSLPLRQARCPDSPIRFVTAAQLIPRKGLDILLEACRSLPADGWTLDIYGQGPERDRLQAIIDTHRLPVTHRGQLPFDRRMAAFRDYECFVFPTRWDGWGMVVVEALAAGLPVISSDQAMSAHDFVINGENGWIVPCESAALATAMRRVIDQRNHIGSWSRAARDSVRTFDPRHGAQAIVRFCHSLLAAATPRSHLEHPLVGSAPDHHRSQS